MDGPLTTLEATPAPAKKDKKKKRKADAMDVDEESEEEEQAAKKVKLSKEEKKAAKKAKKEEAKKGGDEVCISPAGQILEGMLILTFSVYRARRRRRKRKRRRRKRKRRRTRKRARIDFLVSTPTILHVLFSVAISSLCVCSSLVCCNIAPFCLSLSIHPFSLQLVSARRQHYLRECNGAGEAQASMRVPIYNSRYGVVIGAVSTFIVSHCC